MGTRDRRHPDPALDPAQRSQGLPGGKPVPADGRCADRLRRRRTPRPGAASGTGQRHRRHDLQGNPGGKGGHRRHDRLSPGHGRESAERGLGRSGRRLQRGRELRPHEFFVAVTELSGHPAQGRSARRTSTGRTLFSRGDLAARARAHCRSDPRGQHPSRHRGRPRLRQGRLWHASVRLRDDGRNAGEDRSGRTCVRCTAAWSLRAGPK